MQDQLTCLRIKFEHGIRGDQNTGPRPFWIVSPVFTIAAAFKVSGGTEIRQLLNKLAPFQG